MREKRKSETTRQLLMELAGIFFIFMFAVVAVVYFL
jgi:hypothetical protein